MKYAVMIDVDGEWMYVPENPKMFANHPEPRIFDDLQDAMIERDKWNTGIVVDYATRDVIRSMTDEERRRAMVRSLKNGQ
jgi:hypothetical protein